MRENNAECPLGRGVFDNREGRTRPSARMPNKMCGTERRSRTTNRRREQAATASGTRRGQRQKQPRRNPIQGRGMAKQNRRKTRERAQAPG